LGSQRFVAVQLESEPNVGERNGFEVNGFTDGRRDESLVEEVLESPI
jgi:hypothetical protein